jgi:hypothetical protein
MFCAERSRFITILKWIDEIRLKFNSEIGRLGRIIAVADILKYCAFLMAIWKDETLLNGLDEYKGSVHEFNITGYKVTHTTFKSYRENKE